MTLTPRRHQVQNNQTLTTSGNSGLLPNLGHSANPTIILLVDVQGIVSGTSPSLTVSVSSALPDTGYRPTQVGTGTAITASLSSGSPQRVVIHDVLEGDLQVNWVVSGAGASFGGVYIDVIMSSPDA